MLHTPFLTYFPLCSSVSFVNFEQVNVGWVFSSEDIFPSVSLFAKNFS